MTVHTILFYTFEFIAALSALSMLFIKNVFYGTLQLIVCMLSIAGLYVFLNAEFIAVTQVLIYAGGILVLILFGVMLTSKFSGRSLMVKNKHWLPGVFVGLFFLSLLVTLFSETNFYSTNLVPQKVLYTSINNIGILLMSDYALPFEVTGVLMLIALLGAAVVATSFNSTKRL